MCTLYHLTIFLQFVKIAASGSGRDNPGRFLLTVVDGAAALSADRFGVDICNLDHQWRPPTPPTRSRKSSPFGLDAPPAGAAPSSLTVRQSVFRPREGPRPEAT
jgi:hypothetical protein